MARSAGWAPTRGIARRTEIGQPVLGVAHNASGVSDLVLVAGSGVELPAKRCSEFPDDFSCAGDDYDVCVIGAGYGGATVASLLAHSVADISNWQNHRTPTSGFDIGLPMYGRRPKPDPMVLPASVSEPTAQNLSSYPPFVVTGASGYIASWVVADPRPLSRSTPRFLGDARHSDFVRRRFADVPGGRSIDQHDQSFWVHRDSRPADR